ncbi:MAG: ribonuclease P protein component [Phycisphaerales bacterium]|nr:ribonuclease P protein component [Phycisphaerales bacterium]
MTTTPTDDTTGRRYGFPSRLRLTHAREFRAVFDARLRHHAGPMLVHARPNGRDHPRLGLSISRKVGHSVVRSRLRRHLREAFRLLQHDFPNGYDIVISMRRHEPLMFAEYQRLLFKAIRAIDRRVRDGGGSAP